MSRKIVIGGLLSLLLVAGLAVVTGTASAASLRLKYKTSATGGTADQVEPWFNLYNDSGSAVALSGVKIRYYFTADNAAQQYRFACSWAVVSCSTITGTFGNITDTSRYLEVGYTSGTLASGGSTSDMQLRFYRADWQTINQSDDYSFNPALTTYTDWSKVAVFLNGALVWGAPPTGGGVSPSPTPSPTPTSTGNAGVVFDDFAYTNSSDPAISAHHWTVRTNSGGPGVPGASWPASNVSFPVVGGTNKAMQLRAATDGSAGGTSQAEFLHQRKFLEGTYAARVKFADTPTTGPDGDNLVETFFTITPLAFDMDPNYSEQDFEYLPNGGWGVQGPIMYTTTWETYQNEPWNAVNVHTERVQSYNGWHDLVLQVANGECKYYIDGELFATHGGIYYPETVQSVNFNLWFISGGLAGSATPREYVEQVDWFYHAKNEVVAPATVTSRVNAYRTAGTSWVDTVPAT
ncbi:hydrolase [Streptosporangiaceae bacterium NEAU-GS5]|nr:hydrolase [Streptosporangiaceae bacterium NEAU-GS5]